MNEAQSTLERTDAMKESKAEEVESQCRGPTFNGVVRVGLSEMARVEQRLPEAQEGAQTPGKEASRQRTCQGMALRGRTFAHSRNREEAVVVEWGG